MNLMDLTMVQTGRVFMPASIEIGQSTGITILLAVRLPRFHQ